MEGRVVSKTIGGERYNLSLKLLSYIDRVMLTHSPPSCTQDVAEFPFLWVRRPQLTRRCAAWAPSVRSAELVIGIEERGLSNPLFHLYFEFIYIY